jgi:antitoxin (DNA-binding transcriptional repressor) of toxin-antitoxin stability system
MKTSNISYLRNNLSEVLSCVREGESVLVLDRDKPVAKLSPYLTEASAGIDRLTQLEQLGIVERDASAKQLPLPPPLKLSHSVDVAKWILEERESC